MVKLRQGDRNASHSWQVSKLNCLVEHDEQAEREMAAAQRASEAQATAEAASAAAKAADKDGEQETLRQRAWDDWKDDNPRGAGNSKLLPTA